MSEPELSGLQEHIPADVMVEQREGDTVKQVPLRDLPFVKETKDLPSLAKQFYDSQSELGRRVRIPGQEAKDADKAAFRAKLTEAGYLPTVPEAYTITKPDALVDGLTWNDALATKAGGVFKELGLTQAQADRLLAFHGEQMAALVPQLKLTEQQAVDALKTEWGATYDEQTELAKRAVAVVFKGEAATAEFLESTGLGNSPALLKMMAKIGAMVQEDGTITQPGGGAGLDVEGKAVHDIMNNPDNPEHKKYMQGDPDVKKRVEAYYRTRYSTEPVKGASTKKVEIGA